MSIAFIETRDHAEVERPLAGQPLVQVPRVAAGDFDSRQSPRIPEGAGGLKILFAIILEVGVYRDVRMLLHRLQHVATSPRSDVEDLNRLLGAGDLRDRLAESPHQMEAPLPDAAPPDALEVNPVQEPAHQEPARRLVAIDVIEAQAGIETGPPTQGDAAAQPPQSLHDPPHSGELRAAGGLQPAELLVRVAGSVGRQQVRVRDGTRFEFVEKAPDRVGRLCPGRFTQQGGPWSFEPVADLAGRGQSGKENVSRHDRGAPVGGRVQQQGRRVDGGGVCEEAVRSAAEIRQDAGRDRVAKAGRGQHHGAHPRRIVVHPSGHDHRPDAVPQDRDVLDRPLVFDRHLAHERLERACQRSHRRPAPARRITAQDAACVPDEAGCVRQGESFQEFWPGGPAIETPIAGDQGPAAVGR